MRKISRVLFELKIGIYAFISNYRIGRKINSLLPKRKYEITEFYWAGYSGVDENTYVEELTILQYYDLHNNPAIQQVVKLPRESSNNK